MYQGNNSFNNNNAPLPPGWISQWDPNYSRWYFVDTGTGQSTWNDPRYSSVPVYNSKPSFVPGSSATQGSHTNVPDVAPVSVIDPTQAIALELSQSVPSLMGPPPSNASIEVLDAYKQYIRNIQDAQYVSLIKH